MLYEDSETQKISNYMTSIGDNDSLIEDYTVINGEVKWKRYCTVGELYPDCFDEFGNQIYNLPQ